MAMGFENYKDISNKITRSRLRNYLTIPIWMKLRKTSLSLYIDTYRNYWIQNGHISYELRNYIWTDKDTN